MLTAMTDRGTYAVSASTTAELKRKQIVEAARIVLARDGLAGCTARAVADASPLTKSAIHYYFGDINEIVDQAMTAHLDATLSMLRQAVAERAEPYQRLRTAIEVYLDTFAGRPHAAFLWFEYWVASGRRGTTETVDNMLTKIQDLFEEFIDADHIPDAAAVSRRLTSWLLGTVVQQQARPLDPEDLQTEIDTVLIALTRAA